MPISYDRAAHDEVGFALLVGDAIGPWFEQVRKDDAELDAFLKAEGL